ALPICLCWPVTPMRSAGTAPSRSRRKAGRVTARLLIWLVETAVIVGVLIFEGKRIAIYVKAVRGRRGAPQATRIIDASVLDLAPPDKLHPLIEDLRQMGFARLGELEMFCPSGRRNAVWVFG